MLKTIAKILIIILIAVLQLGIFNKISFFSALPNLVMVFGIALTLRNKFYEALVLVLLGGIILDFSSNLHFGILTIFFVMTIFFVNLLVNKLSLVPNVFFFFLVFLGSFLFLDIAISLISFSKLSPTVFIDAFINAIWGILGYFVVQKVIKSEEKLERVDVNF